MVLWKTGSALTMTFSLACPVAAQPTARLRRIGVLRWGASGDEAQALLTQALAALGYVPGQNITIEWRFATSADAAQRHAAELASMDLDLILASATPAAVALRDAVSSVPIVLAGVADPVGARLVRSLARPGGNISGVSSNLPSMVPKQMQLLTEVVPHLQRVAFLGSTQDPVTGLFVNQARQAAQALGLALQVALIRQIGDVEKALDGLQRDGAQALVVQPLFAVSDVRPLVGMLTQRKLPAVTAQRSFARSGGLMAYGFSQSDLARRAASFVDRIFKGASPADLPIEEPTSYDMVINLKSARAMDMVLPQLLLLRADEVIQ